MSDLSDLYCKLSAQLLSNKFSFFTAKLWNIVNLISTQLMMQLMNKSTDRNYISALVTFKAEQR